MCEEQEERNEREEKGGEKKGRVKEKFRDIVQLK